MLGGMDALELLADERARTEVRLAALRSDFAGMVAASESSNADDEHDPEGATIAFERSQVDALLRAAERQLVEVDAAVARVHDGTYGVCSVLVRRFPPGGSRPGRPPRPASRTRSDGRGLVALVRMDPCSHDVTRPYVPTSPEGVVLVLHGGAARQERVAVSPTQRLVIRIIPVARRIARAGGARLATYRLLNSTRGWTPRTRRSTTSRGRWRAGPVHGDLPVSLVGHSLGGTGRAGRRVAVAGDVDRGAEPVAVPTDNADLAGVGCCSCTATRTALRRSRGRPRWRNGWRG